MVLKSVIVLALVMTWFHVEAKKPIGAGRRFIGIGNVSAIVSSEEELDQSFDDSSRMFRCVKPNSRERRDQNCCFGGMKYCPPHGKHGCHALLKLMKRKVKNDVEKEKLVAVGSTIDQHLVGLFVASSLDCRKLKSSSSSEYYVVSCMGERYRLVDVLFHPDVRGLGIHDLALVYFDRKYNPDAGVKVSPRFIGPSLASKPPKPGITCYSYSYTDEGYIEIESFMYEESDKLNETTQEMMGTVLIVSGPETGNTSIGQPLFCDFTLTGLLLNADDQETSEIIYLALYKYYDWVHENIPYPRNRMLKSNARVFHWNSTGSCLFLLTCSLVITLWHKHK